MQEFPNNSQLKTHVRRDQGPRGLNIMILKADGSTRGLNLARSFFGIVIILTLLTLGALAFFAHEYVTLSLRGQSLEDRLDSETKVNELRDYSQAVNMAPEEATRILEILDRAIVMSETDANETALTGIPEPTPEPLAGTETPADPAPAGPDDPAGDTPPAAGEGTGEADGDDRPAADSPPDAPVAEPTPLQAAWDEWHARLTMPVQMASLDIDDFEVSSGGQVTFLLRQNGAPGQREKGRTMVVLAIADAAGAIRLVSAPETDLARPEQGWEMGSKYNIVASKLMRAKAPVPAGYRILSAEIVAWEEDSKELVFRKKIIIEDNR